MAEMDTTDSYVQIRFTCHPSTSDKGIKIPEHPLSVPQLSETTELNSVLTQLLDDSDGHIGSRTFDFLINGTLLRQPISNAIKEQGISEESVVEVECILATTAPVPDRRVNLKDWVSSISCSSSVFLTGCYDNALRVHDYQGNLKAEILDHTDPVKCVKMLSRADEEDLAFISGSHDQTAMVWRCSASGDVLSKMVCKGHKRSVDCVAVNPACDRFATGSYDTYVKIWSTAPRDNASEDDSSSSKTPHPPNKKQRSTTPTITLPTQSPVVTLSAHSETVSGVAWTDPLELWSCSFDHTIKCWDLELTGPKTSLPSQMAFTCMDHNGECIVTGSADPHVRLWDPRSTDKLVAGIYRSHKGWVSSVKWSPRDSNTFVSGSYDQTVLMWDKRSPKAPLFNLEGHEDKVLCLCWDIPDKILSGGADQNVVIYNNSL